jgi:hypothetical protein
MCVCRVSCVFSGMLCQILLCSWLYVRDCVSLSDREIQHRHCCRVYAVPVGSFWILHCPYVRLVLWVLPGRVRVVALPGDHFPKIFSHAAAAVSLPFSWRLQRLADISALLGPRRPLRQRVL